MKDWDERYDEIPEPFNRYMQLPGRPGENNTEKSILDGEALTRQDIAFVLIVMMLLT